MKTPDFNPASHDPKDPDPWLAVFLDRSLPIADIAKSAWLTDCARPCRQWALPFVRPLARLSVILVQVVKLVLPRKLQSSALLHWLIAILIVLNLLVLVWQSNWLLPWGFGKDADRQPGRSQQQLHPEQIQLVPLEAASQAASSPH